jgi:hypothetical protein
VCSEQCKPSHCYRTSCYHVSPLSPVTQGSARLQQLFECFLMNQDGNLVVICITRYPAQRCPLLLQGTWKQPADGGAARRMEVPHQFGRPVRRAWWPWLLVFLRLQTMQHLLWWKSFHMTGITINVPLSRKTFHPILIHLILNFVITESPSPQVVPAVGG